MLFRKSFPRSARLQTDALPALPAAGIAPRKRWPRRRRHGALDWAAVRTVRSWQELRLLPDFAEVLKDVDGFLAAVAGEVDAEEITGIIMAGMGVGLQILLADADIEPLGIETCIGGWRLVALFEW